VTPTPAQLIEGAADALRTYGHFRGNYGSEEEGFCMVGALRYAAHGSSFMLLGDSELRCAYHRAQDLVARAIGVRGIPEFSDTRPTTEVLDKLREAAKLAVDE
jgi:hypothetical protein